MARSAAALPAELTEEAIAEEYAHRGAAELASAQDGIRDNQTVTLRCAQRLPGLAVQLVAPGGARDGCDVVFAVHCEDPDAVRHGVQERARARALASARVGAMTEAEANAMPRATGRVTAGFVRITTLWNRSLSPPASV